MYDKDTKGAKRESNVEVWQLLINLVVSLQQPHQPRLFDQVSSATPENPVTLAGIKVHLNEALEPISLELDEVRNSVEFASSLVEDVKGLTTQVQELEKSVRA